MREVPLSRLCRESPLTPGRARHTLGSWWGWLFHPHRLPHGECGVWGRAPGRTRYAWQLRHLKAHQSRDRRDTSSRCDDSSKARVVTAGIEDSLDVYLAVYIRLVMGLVKRSSPRPV